MTLRRGLHLALLLGMPLAVACGDKTGPGDDSSAEEEGPAWGYDDDTPDSLGPSRWAEAWPDCGGDQQSPIDIPSGSYSLPDPVVLKLDYGTTGLMAINNGHTIQYGVDAYEEQGGAAVRGGLLDLDGETYTLRQFHFHSTSEHSLAGQAWEMEFHMVHQNDAGEIAVLAFVMRSLSSMPAIVENLFASTVGANNPRDGELKFHDALALPATHVAMGKDPDYADLGGELDLDHWFGWTDRNQGATYIGSLTTPPCTEGVRWAISGFSLPLLEEDRDAFRALYPSNNRPLQDSALEVGSIEGGG